MNGPEPSRRWDSDLELARAGVDATSRRLVAMLRDIGSSGAIAIGTWTVPEVAAHLSHVLVFDSASLRGGELPFDVTLDGSADLVGAVARMNASGLARDPERDLLVLADRIEEGISGLLDATTGMRGDEPVAWLAGSKLPCATIVCHMLEESLVHGADIARAERRSWPIPADHAGLAAGFLFDALRFGVPARPAETAEPASRTAETAEPAAGEPELCFDFRIRGARRDFLVFEGGSVAVEDPSSRRVDCRISVEPVTALFLGMGRLGRIRPALSGRLVAWGRKPWLALRLSHLLRNP